MLCVCSSLLFRCMLILVFGVLCRLMCRWLVVLLCLKCLQVRVSLLLLLISVCEFRGLLVNILVSVRRIILSRIYRFVCLKCQVWCWFFRCFGIGYLCWLNVLFVVFFGVGCMVGFFVCGFLGWILVDVVGVGGFISGLCGLGNLYDEQVFFGYFVDCIL